MNGHQFVQRYRSKDVFVQQLVLSCPLYCQVETRVDDLHLGVLCTELREQAFVDNLFPAAGDS